MRTERVRMWKVLGMYESHKLCSSLSSPSHDLQHLQGADVTVFKEVCGCKNRGKCADWAGAVDRIW